MPGVASHTQCSSKLVHLVPNTTKNLLFEQLSVEPLVVEGAVVALSVAVMRAEVIATAALDASKAYAFGADPALCNVSLRRPNLILLRRISLWHLEFPHYVHTRGRLGLNLDLLLWMHC